MQTKHLLFLLFIFFLISCSQKKNTNLPPLAEAQPVSDTYFGVDITDPYRYMENLDDSMVVGWMKKQSDYTREVLSSISGRAPLIEKLKELDQRKSTRIYSLAITDNNWYFYLKMTPEDETGKLFMREGFEGEESLLYDPETFSDDTTKHYVISSFLPSNDGTKVTMEVAPNGSENGVLQIMDVKKKEFYPEKIDHCWMGATSWLPGEESFLYHQMSSGDVHDMEREKNTKTLLHVLGTDPLSDKEVFSGAKYPELGIKPEELPIMYYDRDPKLLFGILSSVDNRLNVFYAPLSELDKDKIAWKRLFAPKDSVYNFGTNGKNFFIYTPKSAPNFKILTMPVSDPDLQKAEVLVPESPDAKINNYILTKDALYYYLTRNGVEAKAYRLPFEEKDAVELKLPFAAGTVLLSNKNVSSNEIWLSISGWTNDFMRYRYFPESNEFVLENLSSTAEYPEYDDLVVEEVMVLSHDGVKVPLSLIYKNDLKKDGNNPVFMFGYGAYGMSINPRFSPNFVLLPTTRNCVVAIAHVRGGGELGEAWHKDGMKTNKPNTWKDLIACAEYLINEDYTSAKKIAINGGSAGGILIGRAMTERPDLFAVAIPEVGCMNTIRAEESPNGPINVPEFGTVKDSVECMALIEMDSYYHIEDGENYPATLVTAGMNDPRVIAWQPAKFAAKLQNANASDKPILLLVDFEAGHGIGDSKSKTFESIADIFSFALWQTGHPEFQVK
ncbi:prolyl oligopeptidase family serine peptidase [Sunxiuqinia sp. A32]|uniref:prolyl oligopeptidase family serine peptidase n=1 Tax=Sunxiuqinia sp. A32 TaxID=3461496 RepID=UPI00404563DB